MSYEYSYVMGERVAGAIAGVLSGIPMGLLGIVGYVLSALALYTLAKRRGINHPWLSWVPLFNCWIIGSLSDQYRYVVRGENKSKRKSLLILNLLNFLLGIAVLVLLVALILGVAENAMYGYGTYMEEKLLEEVIGPLVGVLGLCVPMLGISIAIAVVRYMALYDIYTSMEPGNNVLFLVLSIIFQVTEPFFLFFNRNKDLGMPPRRQEYWEEIPPREEYTWQPPQAEEEPWENPENF